MPALPPLTRAWRSCDREAAPVASCRKDHGMRAPFRRVDSVAPAGVRPSAFARADYRRDRAVAVTTPALVDLAVRQTVQHRPTIHATSEYRRAPARIRIPPLPGSGARKV